MDIGACGIDRKFASTQPCLTCFECLQILVKGDVAGGHLFAGNQEPDIGREVVGLFNSRHQAGVHTENVHIAAFFHNFTAVERFLNLCEAQRRI